MPDISGDMREWLEKQHAYHQSQIEHFRGRRKRNLKEIGRRVVKTRKYNSQIIEMKRVMKGIEDLIKEENWTA
jgi:hypothetical protein